MMNKLLLIFMLLFSLLNETTAQNDVYAIGTTLNPDAPVRTTYSMRVYKNATIAREIESESRNSIALFIEKDHNDIYVFVQDIVSGKYCRMNIHKNDQILYSIAQDSTSIRIKDVCIYNSDVYLVGEATTMKNNDESVNHYIWKNGEVLAPIKTNDSNLDMRDVSAICINEGDIYVAGLVIGKDRTQECKKQIAIWKNGEIINVFSEGSSNIAEAKDIIEYHGDIYVLGEGCLSGFNSSILVWKNGELIYTSPERATAVKMVENDGNIYLLGQYPRKTTKLFVLKDFQPLFEIVEKKDCQASSMIVDSGNVYISGNVVERGDLPKLGKIWKDGKTLYSYKGVGKERYIMVKGLLVF